MKEIQIEDSIRNDKTLLEVVERVTEILNEMIGPSSIDITACWGSFDRLPELISLRITDGLSAASAVAPRTLWAQLAREGRGSILTRLWGDLLQEQSHRQMAKLNLIMQELGKD